MVTIMGVTFVVSWSKHDRFVHVTRDDGANGKALTHIGQDEFDGFMHLSHLTKVLGRGGRIWNVLACYDCMHSHVNDDESLVSCRPDARMRRVIRKYVWSDDPREAARIASIVAHEAGCDCLRCEANN